MVHYMIQTKDNNELINLINQSLKNIDILFEDVKNISKDIYFNERTLKLTNTVQKDDYGYVIQLNLFCIKDIVNLYKKNIRTEKTFNKSTFSFKSKNEIIKLLGNIKHIYYQKELTDRTKQIFRTQFVYDDKMLSKLSIRFLYTFLSQDFHYKVSKDVYLIDLYVYFNKNNFISIKNYGKLMLRQLLKNDKANIKCLSISGFYHTFITDYLNSTEKYVLKDYHQFILKFVKGLIYKSFNIPEFVFEQATTDFWIKFSQYQYLISDLYDRINFFEYIGKKINHKIDLYIHLYKDEIFKELKSNQYIKIILRLDNIIELIKLSEQFINPYMKELEKYSTLIYVNQNDLTALKLIAQGLNLLNVKNSQQYNVNFLIENIEKLTILKKIKII